MSADDYADVCDSGRIKARKIHECDSCHEAIQIGHVYMRTGTLFDGAWSTTKNCLRCWTMIEAILRHTREPVLLTLDCGHEWEDPPDSVAALAFALPGEMQNGGGE